MIPTPAASKRAPGRRISIALAVGVHLVLAALLIYGIHWQTKVNNVVEVELVRQTPAPVIEPRVEPKPEPRPEPKPQPKPEPPPPTKPDIVVKAPPKPKDEPKPKFDPFKQQLAEEEKRLAMDRQITAEQQQLAKQQQAQAASARSKAIAAYSDRIRAKIRGNIVMPPGLKGNPEALVLVTQLPTGEVLDAKLVISSGYEAYDDAVLRAILKSSPLPKPDSSSLFSRDLKLTFRPQD